jgi:ferrous iron transport protein A
MAMGVLPGSQIEYIRKAPFGGGCYVKVDNVMLGLRKAEAASIVLK